MIASHRHNDNLLRLPAPDKSNVSITVTKIKKQEVAPYGKRELLKHMCYFNNKRIVVSQQLVNRDRLINARRLYGQRFLIDLLALSEVYIKHFNKYNLQRMRWDIVYILNTIPNYRLIYEQ